MNIVQLKTFCEIVKWGNAARAASALFMEPTAVSMQLNKLEHDLGGKLFDRSYRPMKLTALGEYLYPRAAHLIAEADKLEYEAKEIAANNSRYLSVGFTRAAMLTMLSDNLRKFKDLYPGIKIDLSYLQSAEQPSKLLSGRIQVGISRFRGSYEPVEGLCYTPIRQDPYVVAVYKGHPLFEKTSITASELNGLTRIEFPKNPSPYDERIPLLLEKAGVIPNYTYYADDIYMALEMVRSALGYCLVVKPSGSSYQSDITYLELSDIHASADIVAVTRKGDINPAAKTFVDFLVKNNQTSVS